MTHKIVAFLSFFILAFYSTAQINIEFETGNKTDALKDGFAKAIVKGGEAPYQYYWSNNATGLTSSISEGLVEGKEYTLVVTDAKGVETTANITVPTQNASESINAGFAPIVDIIGTGLMFDPFAFFGYDNNIYNNEGEVLTHANGDNKTTKYSFYCCMVSYRSYLFYIKNEVCKL